MHLSILKSRLLRYSIRDLAINISSQQAFKMKADRRRSFDSTLLPIALVKKIIIVRARIILAYLPIANTQVLIRSARFYKLDLARTSRF